MSKTTMLHNHWHFVMAACFKMPLIIQSVSGGIVNILGGGGIDYSE